ncbi:unnamed protein product [Rhizophagus irregularis]|nr:unnamed protein product [Rhizophagus irregularis]
MTNQSSTFVTNLTHLDVLNCNKYWTNNFVKNNKIRVGGIVKQALAVSGNKQFRGFKKQERILFKIAIQSSSFG